MMFFFQPSLSLFPQLASFLCPIPFPPCTVGQNNQEYRLEYWATCSSVRLFTCSAHLFAYSLRSCPPLYSLPHLLANFAHSLACGKVTAIFFVLFFSVLAHSALMKFFVSPRELHEFPPGHFTRFYPL